MVLATTGRINYHSIENGDVEVYPTEYTCESTYEYVPYPDNTTIK